MLLEPIEVRGPYELVGSVRVINNSVFLRECYERIYIYMYMYISVFVTGGVLFVGFLAIRALLLGSILGPAHIRPAPSPSLQALRPTCVSAR